MLLQWSNKTIHFLAKPFIEAESLKEYSTKGYWILGGLTAALFILFLLLSGYISGVASQSPDSAQPYLELLLKKVGLDGLPKTLPLSIFIIALYVGLGLIPQTRTYIGEWLSKFFYHFVNFIITGGEWCIEHRGGSTVLVVILISFFIWGLKGVIEKSRREALLTTQFNYWLQAAQGFVVEDTFTKIYNKKIEDVNNHWQDDLDEILELPGGYAHPATYLYKAIALLNLTQKGEPLTQLKVEELDKLVDECKKTCRPVENMDWPERRARDLLHILMGKIYNRIAISDQQKFKKSFDYFESVNLAPYKDKPDIGGHYLFSVNNGKGTIYAGLLTIVASKPDAEVGDIPCKSPAHCALNAFDAYDRAAKDAPPCSFQGRRRTNNLTDLLFRLGLNYEAIANEDYKLKERAKMESKVTLAKEIEAHIVQMLKCNEEGDSIPDFVTVSQAYGTCAFLNSMNCKEETRLLHAAGTYLRIAYSYEPGNLNDWELTPFCSSVKDGEFIPAFKDAISSNAFTGLSNLDPEILKTAIRKQCKGFKEVARAPCGEPISLKP
ncbi:MAG TPA: hypothetical protein VF666_12335 [Pyrinomonadaceae bacterium]|jgi:hypothetical protein